MAAKGAGPIGNNFIPGLRAGADLSAKRYHFVKYETAGLTVVACGAGERPIGVLYNAPESGDPAQVHILDGYTVGPLAVDASTILIGSSLKVDADGKGTVTTTDNDVVAAIAHEPSTAAKEIVAQYVPAWRY